MFQAGGGANSFSHKAPPCSTDLRCYFQCPEAFKKDVDLRIHLKLRHRNEPEAELRRAYQAAEEEIALVKRSASVFQCALCTKKFGDYGSFGGHVRKVHKTKWPEYLEKYGRCEVESAPFECKICGSVVHYSGTRIDSHLKNVHKITWAEYIDYIRTMQRGEQPKELPKIDFYTCKICNTSVKFIKEHLKSTHKVTESEYVELCPDESSQTDFKNEMARYPSEEDNDGGSFGMPQPKRERLNNNLGNQRQQQYGKQFSQDEVDEDSYNNPQLHRNLQQPMNSSYGKGKPNPFYGSLALPDQPLPMDRM
jgi:hypothetical protein